MRNITKALPLTILLSSLAFAAGDSSIQSPDVKQMLWSGCDNCAQPESVYYDPFSGFIFISNVAGEANAKDGRGWIQKVQKSGKVLNAQWVTGLNAPKGLRAAKGTLWVTDIDELVAIDIKSGKIKEKYPVAGATFLNDLALGSDGTVYASDTLSSKIYALSPDGKSSVFAEGPELESPNGLLIQGKELIVAAWGLTTDFSTKVPGRLFALNLKTKKKRLITPEPFANLDGLESDGKGNYLVSDWVAGKVFRVAKDGKAELLLSGFKGAADLGYIPQDKILLVPRMGENQISAYQLK